MWAAVPAGWPFPRARPSPKSAVAAGRPLTGHSVPDISACHGMAAAGVPTARSGSLDVSAGPPEVPAGSSE
ncbi:hypothetical protein JCM9534A_26140 [Catenuloplanes indicus JCM 9534]